MKAKKIILFIVEGITDKTCLGYVLNQLICDQSVHFALTDGDITTRNGNKSANISTKIFDEVKRFSGNTFKAKDFLEVVHLVDLDGAYISGDRIKQSVDSDPYYADENIQTNNVDGIRKRNEQKSEILNRLITLKRVWKTVPYSVYFFSCNLDHVLHGQQNMTRQEKSQYANQFEKRYLEQPAQFIDFISSNAFAVQGHYDETWSFIKLDAHSLQRYTNFHLYFSEPPNPRMIVEA